MTRWVALLSLTLLLGTTFPLKSTSDNWANYGFQLHEGPRSGICSTPDTRFIAFAIENDTGSRWIVYYSETKLVAVFYLNAEIPQTIFFAKIVNEQIIPVRQEDFDAARHIGPCQWLEELET